MTNGQRLDLAVNVSSTSGSQIWPGGRGVFMVEATWGGGTVKNFKSRTLKERGLMFLLLLSQPMG
jgi:hypothetical protein